MNVRTAAANEVEIYFDFARAAQIWISSRGLGQYVPAAHEEYATDIRRRAASGTLFAACDPETPVGFFLLDSTPTRWWPAASEPMGQPASLYLSGMVLAPHARGRGLGGRILRWCAEEGRCRGCRSVRLDCHAGNSWLCDYYRRNGFILRGRIAQLPGYEGCLFERPVTLDGNAPAVLNLPD